MGFDREFEETRPNNKLNEMLEFASKVAHEESSDTETQVGASCELIREDGSTLIIGAANTFVKGAKNLPTTRPGKYAFMMHAEQNLVFLAAKYGYSLANETVYCTLSPCQNCIRTLWQAGVREIYYLNRYRDHNPVMDDLKVTETQVGEYTHMKLENHD